MNRVLLLLSVWAVLWPASGYAQSDSTADYSQLSQRLDAQAEEIRALRNELERVTAEQSVAPLVITEDSCGTSESTYGVPLYAEFADDPSCTSSPNASAATSSLKFDVDYDRGFLIKPFDPKRHPFQLKINAWVQVRHHALVRNAETWTDNAGVTRPIRQRNVFDIERARLTFGGTALDPRLTYFLQLDGDTDGRHTVDFFDYWWSWKFDDAFRVQFGKRKVSASRQWLLGARDTRFVDRPMANDFFRPDRTIGVFGLGKIGDTGHYEFMVGNGYRTSNLPTEDIDNRFTFAFSNHFDPHGDFGKQIVDYAGTRDSLLRIGHSFVYSPQAGDAFGTPLGEADFVRLSDGTRLTATGAISGVTVVRFDLYFYGVDLAWKWRGWSVNSEVFFRWIQNMQGTGSLSSSKLFQRGFYVEGGHFLIPQKLDVNVRYSQVSGLYGNASEYAAGFNWYPLDTRRMKVSFDATVLDGSPLQNTTSDILVGDNGTLLRTQVQAEF